MGTGEITAIVFASVVFALMVAYILLVPQKFFFKALFAGAYISSWTLLAMKSRKINLDDVVSAYIISKKTKLGITLHDFELISIGGGSATNVATGLNTAKLAKIGIDLKFATAVDVAGLGIMQVVSECVKPKVIELPLVTATTMDLHEINVKVSLSLKINLKNYLNGVTDETISARGVEAVVTKIANTTRAQDLIAHPEFLDKAIFDAGIDENAKYELVSADVIHIDLGKDKGAEMEKDRMEKDHLASMRRLEQRKAEALAVQEEMKARAEEMNAKTAANNAEVPKALKKAIEDGKIKDITEYYKLQNLMTDTQVKMNMLGKKNEEDE